MITHPRLNKFGLAMFGLCVLAAVGMTVARCLSHTAGGVDAAVLAAFAIATAMLAGDTE